LGSIFSIRSKNSPVFRCHDHASAAFAAAADSRRSDEASSHKCRKICTPSMMIVAVVVGRRKPVLPCSIASGTDPQCGFHECRDESPVYFHTRSVPNSGRMPVP
jgi:hypothetical protein